MRFLFILLFAFSVNAQIPNTAGGWSLDDVRSYIGLSSTTSLQECFTYASSSCFDATYQGSKDRLSNFRNYDCGPIITAFEVSTITYGSLLLACSGTPSYITKYFNRTGPFPFPEIGDVVYNDSGMTTPFNGGNSFYKLRSGIQTGSNQIGLSGISAATTTLCP